MAIKYMGSKRSMLSNGLGDLLEHEISRSKRFFDLFAGSGAVATHVAGRYDIPVFAYDLQAYSVVLASAVLNRNEEIDGRTLWNTWFARARKLKRTVRSKHVKKITKESVRRARIWCDGKRQLPITRAYGGHYFSPDQAIWIDCLRATLPRDKIRRRLALASLIEGASHCVAAPGHTAQPFQPTKTAKKFLAEAWKKNVARYTRAALIRISATSSRKLGEAEVLDAHVASRKMKSGDLAFIDPPYSGVHYSRFYHVLESIARGRCGPVSGVGRYPAAETRPRSRYSLSSESETALDELFKRIAARKAKAIVTFPDHECSNGLSGVAVRKIARKHFKVREMTVSSRFSTLGGNGIKIDTEGARGRDARHQANELILVLTSKPK